VVSGPKYINNRGHRADYSLMIAVCILLLMSLVVIYSISPVLSHQDSGDVNKNIFFYKHLRNMAIALLVGIACSRMRVRKWRSLLPVLIVGSGLSLLLLMIPGFAINVKGATRWVGIGPVSFQPAEILKLTTLVAIAAYGSQLNSASLKDARKTLWPALGLLGSLGLFVLILQKDMGTMLVLAAIVVTVFYVSGIATRQVGYLLASGLMMGIVSIVLFPHRVERVVTFLNPSGDLADTGYHLNQALIGVGSGGFLGLGIGKSVQVFGYLPEAPSDSIFAIIAESFGFIGAFGTLALISFIIYRGIKIAVSAPNRFSQLLAIGIVAWIGTQSLVNIAAILGLIPLTGIPLPFISNGGTSMITMMAAVGILLNISKHTERGVYADSTQWRRHRRPSNANLSSR
jgi:cell division protein FtsW